MLNPGVYSSFPLALFFTATSAITGVKLIRPFGESPLTGVRQSCPRLGEGNAPVSSRTMALAGFEAPRGEQGGDLEGDFPTRLGDGEGGVTRFTTVL